MSWNATVYRLRARAQHDALTDDTYTRTLLYEAVDQIERYAAALDVSEEQRAERERVLFAETEWFARRVPNADDLRSVCHMAANNAARHADELAAPALEVIDRVRATMEES